MKRNTKSLPRKIKLYYALGQLGWSLNIGLINTWLIWYYLPAKDAQDAVKELFIPQGSWIFGVTVIGVITMLGRLIDAITDPLIASLSDRSEHPKGRRISFMMKGALPFTLFTILVFYSPVNGISNINILMLTFALIGLYIAFTMYVTPYFALISELGKTPEEKLDLSTYISVTFFIGMAIASIAPYIWGVFENAGLARITSIRVTIIILASIGFAFMLIPVFKVDERKYADSKPSNMPLFKSLKATFSYKDFVYFTVSDLAYWIALTMFQTGMSYYVTVLAQLDNTWTGNALIFTGVLSFICYPFINMISKKVGKKPLIVFAFILFIITYLVTSVLGRMGSLSGMVQLLIVIVLAAIPMAIFGILPNAMIADIAEYDANKTGNNKEAMFFAARTFMSKLGAVIAMGVFTTLLIQGKSIENDFGIRLTAIAAAIICAVALVLFLKYNEAKILGKDQ